jgi:hypothetical protein
LLTASEAASLCKIPPPIHIGRKPLWRPDDLRAWIAASCPDRETWAVMRD